MRYLLLIYSQEQAAPLTPSEDAAIRAGHRAVMEDAARRGILLGAEPLHPTSTATTVRRNPGDANKVMVTDGPFAETKEQLAGYYLLECTDLDEALEWAARIPTGCAGAPGCIEVRPVRPMQGKSAAASGERSERPES